MHIVDNGPNPDHAKAGDVIAIMPDGWQWSKLERTRPDWRIISAPGIEAQHRDLLRDEHQQRALENPKDPLSTREVNPKASRRATRLIVDRLPEAQRKMLQANRDGDGIVRLEADHVAAMRARVITANTDRIIG